ncbi:MAG: DUF2848 family protein [Solirubrobacterales bacterium]
MGTGLKLSVQSGDQVGAREVVLEDPQLIVAGFTGRDPTAVDAHIAELRELGVPAPPEVPVFFPLPNELLSLAPTVVRVRGGGTSGEAEPVLIRMPDGEIFVGVGSDHTDRELERESLAASKSACAKPLAGVVWPFAEVAPHWDELVLSAQSGADGRPYQRSTLADIREPSDLLGRIEPGEVDPARPVVLYLGTVALEDGFRFDRVFRAALQDPRSGRELVCAYEIREEE